MKVYVVSVSSNVYGSWDFDLKVFANYKDAKLEFDEEVKRSKRYAGEDWVEDVSDDVYATYVDGEYDANHIDVLILEKEVIL